MAKNPYIPFYIGDHLKDTRILPLNVQGGWMILLLYMWENDPKGELIGTMEDFTRLMSCSAEEAILVIQTLKEKKIFAWEDLHDGKLRIISRKQKRMIKLSEIRQKSGKNGGNPNLVNQKQSKDTEMLNQRTTLVNQNNNQNPEYENKEAGQDDVGNSGGEEGPQDWKPPEGPEWERFQVLGSRLPTEMMAIFVESYPDYPQQGFRDHPACWEFAYQLAVYKSWQWQKVLNGSMDKLLFEWREIVTWARGDSWYGVKPIAFWNKDFQGLIQKKNNGRSQTNAASSKPGTSEARTDALERW